ncbi:MAG TPA: rhomboid family intramembrane serine protease [Tepidisphaeraceae bacterium]|nr:rhomboid family intramembrane serine protease [Tepidisphaeraceae bacterium]
MGWQDREYYRASEYEPSRFGRMPGWSVTTWLIVVNVAVFVLDPLLSPLFGYPPLLAWGYFSADAAIYHLQIWRFFTFQFLHASLGHIFFNMLALYFFGPLIESYLGRKRFLTFYLLCGIAGAVSYLLLWMMGILIAFSWVPLVGASAGIFGVLIAAARIAPDAQVFLLFPPIPLRLKTMAWILLGIAAFTIVVGGNNAGGQAAHLGGAALGYLLIENPWALNRLTFSLPTLSWRKRSSWRERGYFR